MKVILLQDVAKIGRRFDIVEVSNGYGMNKLIPQAMAKPATPENIKNIQTQSAKSEATRLAADEAFSEMVTSVQEVILEIAVESNEEGRMFQALKIEAVIDAVYVATQKKISTSQVIIKTPIKEVGQHTVEFISGDIVVPIQVNVIAK